MGWAVSFFTKTGVLGAMHIGDVPPLAVLKDDEFVHRVWVGSEEGSKIKWRDDWLLGFCFEVGVLVIQFDC